MNNKNVHVILGVTGGIGSAVARELVKQGKIVRGLNRSSKVKYNLVPDSVEIVSVDVMDFERMKEVLSDAKVLYNCLNVPYSKWTKQFVDITKQIIQLANELDLPLVVADNLYMYNEEEREPLHEKLPHSAEGPKGRIRIKMAKLYMDAHTQGKIKMVMIRGPDYYGPGALHTSYYGNRIFEKVFRDQMVRVIGNPDMLHTIIYIDDFAKAIIKLGDDDSAYGQAWHAPSDDPITQREFVQLVGKTANKNIKKVGSVNKMMLSIAGLFNKEIKEVKEMYFEFEKPYLVSHDKFINKFEFDITSFEDGIRQTIEWYNKNYYN